MSLSKWYHVTFDVENIYRNVNPPNEESWTDQLQWKDIIRICFKLGDLYTSDELYMFTDKREESYLIPIEANGGIELWNEIISRKLFDADLAIKIASTIDGIYCWPQDDR